MNKRLIYAEDAIEEIVKRLGIRDESYLTAQEKSVVQVLKDMPSAQPEHTETHSCDYQRTETHGWIPVTEALPKEEDCPMDCLVTRKSKFIGNYTDIAVCEKNGTWTHEDWDAIVLGDVEDGKSTGMISTRDDNIHRVDAATRTVERRGA